MRMGFDIQLSRLIRIKATMSSHNGTEDGTVSGRFGLGYHGKQLITKTQRTSIR